MMVMRLGHWVRVLNLMVLLLLMMLTAVEKSRHIALDWIGLDLDCSLGGSEVEWEG